MKWDKLPTKFKISMEELFTKASMQNEFQSFCQSFDQEWKRAWRVQANKVEPNQLAEYFSQVEADYTAEDFLQKVPWSHDGYYIPGKIKLGKNLAYVLGFIYIQEASAMLPAEVLAARPGENILDLCAAPGGKSSQTAARLQGEGLLVANDISDSRARVLAANMNLQGFKNVIVTSFDLAKGLPDNWQSFFDGVQLDVPCSGEGMFRRDNTAIKSWEEYGPSSIRDIQLELLENSANLVKPGGRIVYSTCTFNTWENEAVIRDFLRKHPEFSIEDPRPELSSTVGIRKGIVIDENYQDLAKALRIWPQDNLGEGHFCIRLRKKESRTVNQAEDKTETKIVSESRFNGTDYRIKACEFRPKDFAAGGELKGNNKKRKNQKNIKGKNNYKQAQQLSLANAIEIYREFIRTNVKPEAQSLLLYADYNLTDFKLVNNNLYVKTKTDLDLNNLHLLKSGTLLGTINTRSKSFAFTPSRELLIQNSCLIWSNLLNLDLVDGRINTLISGGTFVLQDNEKKLLSNCQEQSFIPLAVNNYPLTWTKLNGSTLKNLLPQILIR